jgi:hypothetical protein
MYGVTPEISRSLDEILSLPNWSFSATVLKFQIQLGAFQMKFRTNFVQLG